MATRQRSRGRQEHPEGPSVTVDDLYRARVEAELKRRGLNQKDLAGEISVVPATITNMLLHKKPIKVATKEALDRFFGWVETEAVADVWRGVEAERRHLTKEQAEHIAATIRLFAAKNSPTNQR